MLACNLAERELTVPVETAGTQEVASSNPQARLDGSGVHLPAQSVMIFERRGESPTR